MNEQELDEIFAPLIDSPSLTLTTIYWEEAKAKLLKWRNEAVREARIDQDKHSRGDEFLWFVRKIREYDFDKDVIEQNLIQPNEGKYRAYFEEQDRIAQLNPKEKNDDR